jgi:hypothetical protein
MSQPAVHNQSKAEVEASVAATKKLHAQLGEMARALTAKLQPNSAPQAVGRDGGLPSFDEVYAVERAAIARSTDLAVCDADPLGDGDQRPLRGPLKTQAGARPGTDSGTKREWANKETGKTINLLTIEC